jgi:acyl-CoA dehydrogenase
MVRQQFGLPIGRMEGVEEKVGHISGLTYMLEASRVFGCSAIDNGEQPPVVSAVLKAYSTDLYQKLSIDGMDVMAGAAVMQGPNNILARNYTSAPVGVTVEGANILTRTLMIFGQGATRCHPYAFKVVEGVTNNDVKMFRTGLLGWIGHFLRGLLRAEVHFLTRGLFVPVPDVSQEMRTYYRRLGWAAARFGVMTDLAMFAIGGKLKARGKLTGRYADALAWMMMGFSALRRFEAEGRRAEDAPMVHYAATFALNKVQEAFVGIYRNFDGPLGLWMKSIGVFELHVNPLAGMPTDRQSHAAALCIQNDGPQFQRLAEGVFLPKNEEVGLGRLMRAFRIVSAAHPAAEKIIRAQKAKKLPRGYLPAEIADEAVKAGIVTADEAAMLKQALAARLDAIQVDEFKPDEYFATVTREGGLEYKMAVNA